MGEKLKIKERLLGREKAFGLTYDQPLIEIDPRQFSRSRLNTVVHEMLHRCFPDWSESKVRRISYRISAALWKDNWRRICK